MKKFAVLILALALMCSALTGCGNSRGNISNDKNGVVTDSPNDADDIIDDDDDGIVDNNDDGITDDDSSNRKDSDKDKPAATTTPGSSPAVTQSAAP